LLLATWADPAGSKLVLDDEAQRAQRAATTELDDGMNQASRASRPRSVDTSGRLVTMNSTTWRPCAVVAAGQGVASFLAQVKHVDEGA